MRYIEEARFRFSGPAARRYISQARTLVGRWLATLPENQQDGVYRARLVDGALIDITMVGRELTIEITAPAPPLPAGTFNLSGFILTPTSATYPPPDGLDAAFPQIVLSPVSGQLSLYGCWFSNADTDASRIALYPRRYLPLAPEGFKEFGEVDWQGAAGRSLSFRGPAARYFPDRFVAPNFDVYVWSCGRLLFDGAEYAARPGADSRSGWPIAGAAMRVIDGQVWLVCVHVDAATFDADLYSVNLHLRSDFAVIRYGLDFTTFAATNSFVVMGTFSSGREGAPFCFDEAGERAVRVITIRDGALDAPYDVREELDADAALSTTALGAGYSPLQPNDDIVEERSAVAIAYDWRASELAALTYEVDGVAPDKPGPLTATVRGAGAVIEVRRQHSLPDSVYQATNRSVQYADLRSSLFGWFELRAECQVTGLNAYAYFNTYLRSLVVIGAGERADAAYLYEVAGYDFGTQFSTDLNTLGFESPYVAGYFWLEASRSLYGFTDFEDPQYHISPRQHFIVLCGRQAVVFDAGAGSFMEDRVRTKNGATLFGTWGYVAGRYFTSMASFANPYFNTLTAALPSGVTGVQGAAAFFPGTVMPRYLPES